MGFVGLIGEPGIVGGKVSKGAGDKPSELVLFNQERQGLVGLRAAGIAPPPSGSGIPYSLRTCVPVSVPHVPVSKSPCLQHNQTLAWPPVNVCTLGLHSCLLASPSLGSTGWIILQWALPQVLTKSSILERRPVRFQKKMWLAQGHPDHKCQNWDLNQVHHCRPTFC